MLSGFGAWYEVVNFWGLHRDQQLLKKMNCLSCKATFGEVEIF